MAVVVMCTRWCVLLLKVVNTARRCRLKSRLWWVCGAASFGCRRLMSSLQVEGARVFCLEPRELLLKIREPLLELGARRLRVGAATRQWRRWWRGVLRDVGGVVAVVSAAPRRVLRGRRVRDATSPWLFRVRTRFARNAVQASLVRATCCKASSK